MNFDPFPQPIDDNEPADHDLHELEDELQLDDEFRLEPPVEQAEEWDDDSIGELSTNDSIVIDDSRDLIDVDYDEPVDYYGADLRYEDYEPSPYDGTYSEE